MMRTWSLQGVYDVAAEFLAALERITRPPRMGHDVDVAETPEAQTCAKCGRVSPKCKPIKTWVGELSYCPECPPYPGEPMERAADEPQCGAIHPELPYAICTRRGYHEGSHGYAGTFWDDIPDDTPNPCEPSLSDDELVAVRGLIQERYGVDSPPWLHELIEATIRYVVDCGISEDDARAFIDNPNGLPIDRLLDRRLHGDQSLKADKLDGQMWRAYVQDSADGSVAGPADRPAGLIHSPESPAGHLTWVNWATPAIATVLANHRPLNNKVIDGAIYCCDYEGGIEDEFGSHDEWSEHVAPLIAAALVVTK